MAVCLYQVLALGRLDVFVLHGDGPAGGRLDRGGLAGVEVVPGVVTDVVCALRLVDADEIDRPALVAQGDADVVAVDRTGPVGDPICVDLAAQNTDGGRVTIVRGSPDCPAAAEDGRRERKAGRKENGAAHGEDDGRADDKTADIRAEEGAIERNITPGAKKGRTIQIVGERASGRF